VIFEENKIKMGAPPKTAAALLPVSAAGLGPPRPNAANAAGPGSTALWRGLQSCLARGNRYLSHLKYT